MKKIKTKLALIIFLLIGGGLFAQEIKGLYDYKDFFHSDKGIFSSEFYKYSVSPIFNGVNLTPPLAPLQVTPAPTAPQSSVRGDTVAMSSNTPKENVSLEVYPNPDGSTLEIHLKSSKAGYVSISAYNMLGKQVADIVTNQYSEKNLNASFFVGSLPRGMYIVVATKNGERTAQKIVID